MAESKSLISSTHVQKIFNEEGFNKQVLDQLKVINKELKELRLQRAPNVKSDEHPDGVALKDLQAYKSTEYQEIHNLFELHKKIDELHHRKAGLQKSKEKEDVKKKKEDDIRTQITGLIKEVNASKALNAKSKKLFTENNFGKEGKLLLVIPEQSTGVANMVNRQKLMKQKVQAHKSSVEFLCKLSESVVMEIISDAITNCGGKSTLQISHVPNESQSPYRPLYQHLEAFKSRSKDMVATDAKFAAGIKKLYKSRKSGAHNLSKDLVTFLVNVVYQLAQSYAAKVMIYLGAEKRKQINADTLRVMTDLSFHAVGKSSPLA